MIQSYVQKLIENLEKIDKDNQYFIFLLKENFEEFQPKNKNFEKVLADYRWYTFSEQINMPKLLNKYDLATPPTPKFKIELEVPSIVMFPRPDDVFNAVVPPTIKFPDASSVIAWVKEMVSPAVPDAATNQACDPFDDDRK